MTGHAYLLEIEGLFTQGSRPGRTVGEWVGGMFAMVSSNWSNGIRYHTFDTRSDTEFQAEGVVGPSSMQIGWGGQTGIWTCVELNSVSDLVSKFWCRIPHNQSDCPFQKPH